MNGKNIVLALELARTAAAYVAQLLGAAGIAHAEGRDLTNTELDRFRKADDAARAELDAKIAAKRAGG